MRHREMNRHGDGAPDMGMSNAEEAFRDAVTDLYDEVMDANGDRPLESSYYLWLLIESDREMNRDVYEATQDVLRKAMTRAERGVMAYVHATHIEALATVAHARHRRRIETDAYAEDAARDDEPTLLRRIAA
jgi:hypothetical protein